MPILHVRALPQTESEHIKVALEKACLAISNELGCDLDKVWATWEELKPGYYIEGKESRDVQGRDSHPPICELKCFEGMSAEKIDSLLIAVSRALSEGLGCEGNLFVSFHEIKSGHAIAGTNIVKKKAA